MCSTAVCLSVLPRWVDISQGPILPETEHCDSVYWLWFMDKGKIEKTFQSRRSDDCTVIPSNKYVLHIWPERYNDYFRNSGK